MFTPNSVKRPTSCSRRGSISFLRGSLGGTTPVGLRCRMSWGWWTTPRTRNWETNFSCIDSFSGQRTWELPYTFISFQKVSAFGSNRSTAGCDVHRRVASKLSKTRRQALTILCHLLIVTTKLGQEYIDNGNRNTVMSSSYLDEPYRI